MFDAATSVSRIAVFIGQAKLMENSCRCSSNLTAEEHEDYMELHRTPPPPPDTAAVETIRPRGQCRLTKMNQLDGQLSKNNQIVRPFVSQTFA